MTDTFKSFKTHECASELLQCAFCQVEQAAAGMNLAQKLKDKWQASLSLLEETEFKFKNYLHSTAAIAKDDIDIKVESLKSELDTLRESLFNDVDETVGQLEEDFKTDSELNALNEYLKEQKIVQDNLISKYDESIKKNVERIQKYHDTLFKIKFEPYEQEIDVENTIGSIQFTINKQIPDTFWQYKYDNLNEDRLRCLRTIQLEDELPTNPLHLGNNMMACNTNANDVKIWDTSDGTLIRELKGAGCLRAVVQGSRMITAMREPNLQITIWDLRTFEKKVFASDEFYTCFVELENGSIASTGVKRNQNDEGEEQDYDEFKVTLWCIEGLDLKVEKSCTYEDDTCVLEPLKGDFFASNYVSEILIWSSRIDEYLMPSRSLSGHDGRITCIKYIKGHNVLLSGSVDQRVIFWNYETGDKLREIMEWDPVMRLFDLGDGFFVNQNHASLGVFNVEHAELVGTILKTSFSESSDLNWNFVKLPNGQYAFLVDRVIKIVDFKAQIQYY